MATNDKNIRINQLVSHFWLPMVQFYHKSVKNATTKFCDELGIVRPF